VDFTLNCTFECLNLILTCKFPIKPSYFPMLPYFPMLITFVDASDKKWPLHPSQCPTNLLRIFFETGARPTSQKLSKVMCFDNYDLGYF